MYMYNHIWFDKINTLLYDFFWTLQGETGSGKTSFINLLLGEDLLPTSLMSNTHVICEIRHGNLYKAIFHCLDETKQVREYSTSSDFKRNVSEDLQATDNNKKPIYKKVQLFLPVDILEVSKHFYY